MKKKILLLLIVASMSGCNTPNESFMNSSIPSVNDSSNVSLDVMNDSSSVIEKELHVDIIFQPEDSTPTIQEKVITLSNTTYNKIGNYSTGNYANQYNRADMAVIDGITFEHYRALKYSGGLLSLLPYYENDSDNTLPGAFYNVTAISTINRMFLHYKTENNDENGFKIHFGEDLYTRYTSIIPGSTETNYVELDFTNVNYFKIETDNQIVSFTDITIYYEEDSSLLVSSYSSSGKDEYRLNPQCFEGDLVDGQSSIEIPMKVQVNLDGSYTVTEKKKYTYYSYEYVKEHPEVADDAAMVHPVDVATYYIAFKKYPANYFESAKSALSDATAYLLFGNRIRQVSQEYSRRDGYVNAIPYKLNYIEFDIDIGNTYIINRTLSRGVGRVVIFINGFDVESYDDSPVAVLTDDHYSTFQEYLNTGTYGKRFNAQSRRTIYQWGEAKCLN